ncbi:hypothetical protein DH2020_037756 [Rehmannia glutinosa]|uniref:Uncharacterized protein n=1 Tax=Rehmannia glutinosa TaxID=99300 RepID=A0ABR0V0I0_REHGL
MRLQSQHSISTTAFQANFNQAPMSVQAAPSANIAYETYNSRDGVQFSRGRGRGGRNFGFRNNSNRPKCQLCWKTGHVALKCYKRFDISFTGPDPATSSVIGFSCCVLNFLLAPQKLSRSPQLGKFSNIANEQL